MERKEIRETIGNCEYVFYIYKTFMRVYRVSSKARWGMVYEYLVGFKWEEQMKREIDRIVNVVLARQFVKESRKKERIERSRIEKEQMLANINVGDLLHDSRWYDMTHNDFLQVVDKKGKKVFCRTIWKEYVSGDDGYTGYERPIKDCFKDEGKRYVIGRHWIRLNDYRHARKSEWDRDYYYNYMD